MEEIPLSFMEFSVNRFGQKYLLQNLLPHLSYSALVMVLLVSFAPSAVVAGELTNKPRISNGERNMKYSTHAARALGRNRNSFSGKVYALRSSNIFESRILDQQRARLKYEADVERWERRVAKMQTTAERKELAQERKLREREERRLDRERKEQQRAEERQQRGTMLSRFSGGDNPKEALSEEDQKSRRAEAFFGEKPRPKEGENGGVIQESKPRLSFWQRLKRAVFGG